MNTEHPNITLRKRIEALPEDSVLFRSDFPEYHSEFVGETLAELTQEGLLVKLAQGIYAKPRWSRFGVVVSSNFVSADFRKMRTDSFQKSRTTRFRKIRVVR